MCSATTAVELLPEWSEGHLTLARCQLQMGELELAINSFKEALRLEVDTKYVVIFIFILSIQIRWSIISLPLSINFINIITTIPRSKSDISMELDAAQNLYTVIENERKEFVLDRNAVEESLPPLRRKDDDFDEIERCIKNLAIRPGYSVASYNASKSDEM